MFIKSAKYIASYPNLKACPEADLPEYAFVGRSNVGKSSLINLITDHRKLAKVSHTPGKTQMLNYFLINDAWYLVDLPGYGYAKISRKTRHQWGDMMKQYLAKRTSLSCVFLLIDSRIKPQAIDLEFVDWLGKEQVPFAIVFTKADKPKDKAIKQNIEAFKEALKEMFLFVPANFTTSAAKKRGAKEIMTFIEETNEAIQE